MIPGECMAPSEDSILLVRTNIKTRFLRPLWLTIFAGVVLLANGTPGGAQTVRSSESTDGTVVVWGANNYGQRVVPAGLGNVVAIAAGGHHNVILNQDGTVVAWGLNASSQTNVPEGLSNVVAISAGGMHSVALKGDGSMVAWGQNNYGQRTVPAGLSNVVAIAAGGTHNAALKQDGTVVAWGNNGQYQTNVPVGLSNVLAVATGDAHTLALRQDGTIVAWGENRDGQSAVPGGLSNVLAIAAGNSHSAALRQDGTVVVWGTNSFYQINVPAGLSNVVAIAAGGTHIAVLKRDGTVATWGNNYWGQTGAGVESDVLAIAAGGSHTVAIRRLPPSITAQMFSRTVNVGQSARFGVAITGSWPLSYKWRKDGVDISGATNARYTIPSVVGSDAGNYSVVVSNLAGSMTSAGAQLTVLDTPAFVTHPVTQTVGIGSNIVLSAIAYGAPPLVFQWYSNGNPVGPPIANTNVAVLTLTNVQTNQAGLYSVEVLNGYGSATSSDAVVSVVMYPPKITMQSPDQRAELGKSVTFTVTVTGTAPLRYQWRFNGTAIPGATNDAFTVSSVAHSDGGNYSVVVANSAGSVTSSDAALTVVVFPPRITGQPLNQSQPPGSSVMFTVAVGGTPPFLYQWRFNDGDIPGATNAVYTIPAVAVADGGTYSVVVANSAGSVTSDTATLSVIVPPTLGLHLLAGYPVLRLGGMLGSNFSVQYSSDLSGTNWTSLRSFSNLSVNPYQFLDAGGSTSPARFYRAVMQ